MRTQLRTLVAASLFAFATVAFGQITGDLRGVVLDSQGGAISQAKVTLKSLETGEVRTADVSADGAFNFALLKIGNYEVKAESTGFRTSSTQAQVRAGEVGSVRFVMEVGQVTETVTVTDAVAQLDTQNSQIQSAVVGKAVLELPVNRNPNLFALMLPGTVPVTANNPFLGSGSFNSNGGRGRGNNITVDGITSTDVSVTGTGGSLTPLVFQTLQEVKVISNNFSAEYGRNSSSQVIYLTKSGTNQLHGELFEFFQNDKLNARPFFDRTGKTNIVRLNQYGFVVGGPVYIPKLADLRNRVFWSVAYEGQKQRGAGATRIARVPTPAQLSSVTDPTASALVKQYQLQSDPSGQITTSTAEAADIWKVNIRGDVNLTSRDTLWVRYNPADQIQASSGNTFIGTNLPGFGTTSANSPRHAIAAHTHLFGTTAVNEFRFGFGQSKPFFPFDTPYALGPRITFQDAS
ncbi:MAG TPA: carboxypeptidase-like regulatory domain-containing protein, partial [Bryobacteraceae bacterium]|nr:carboxypeptidase-like regulatory domain-containing protein [Bryobacteraceae bacterium]